MLRNLREECMRNAYGGATAGLRITPIPALNKKKRRVSPDCSKQEYTNLLLCDKSRSKPMPIKPLYFTIKLFLTP